jgi:hypothetical protein
VADNTTYVDASGATRTLRTRDTGAGVQAEKVDVAPWVPTPTGDGIVVSVNALKKNGAGFNLPAGTTHVLVTVKSGDVMWSETATDPTSTNGSGWLPAGSVEEFAWTGHLAFIQADTSAGTPTIILAPRSYS